MTKWIAIVDEAEGRLCTWFAEDEPSCNAREYGDLCGGCRTCMLQQASHYGYKILEGLDDSDLAELEVELAPLESSERKWYTPQPGDKVAIGVDFAREGSGERTTMVTMRKRGTEGAKAEIVIIDDIISLPPSAEPPPDMITREPSRADKRRLVEAMKAAVFEGKVRVNKDLLALLDPKTKR
ncbi:MAG: hypothetical protein AB7W59_00440 [Acidimicrobiia bacterium]